MTKDKKIKIDGKEYPVVFNMQALINFEEIANKSFFGETFTKMSDRLALASAAIIAFDKYTDFDMKATVENATLETIQDINKSYNDVMDLAKEFFKISDVDKELEEKPAEDDKEDQAKN